MAFSVDPEDQPSPYGLAVKHSSRLVQTIEAVVRGPKASGAQLIAEAKILELKRLMVDQAAATVIRVVRSSVCNERWSELSDRLSE